MNFKKCEGEIAREPGQNQSNMDSASSVGEHHVRVKVKDGVGSGRHKQRAKHGVFRAWSFILGFVTIWLWIGVKEPVSGSKA